MWCCHIWPKRFTIMIMILEFIFSSLENECCLKYKCREMKRVYHHNCTKMSKNNIDSFSIKHASLLSITEIICSGYLSLTFAKWRLRKMKVCKIRSYALCFYQLYLNTDFILSLTSLLNLCCWIINRRGVLFQSTSYPLWEYKNITEDSVCHSFVYCSKGWNHQFIPTNSIMCLFVFSIIHFHRRVPSTRDISISLSSSVNVSPQLRVRTVMILFCACLALESCSSLSGQKQFSATHATHTLVMYSLHLPLSAQWFENNALCKSKAAICETSITGEGGLLQCYVMLPTQL